MQFHLVYSVVSRRDEGVMLDLSQWAMLLQLGDHHLTLD